MTYRWVYKQRRRLAVGYYRPHLSADELYRLAPGESAVCTDRQRCRDHYTRTAIDEASRR